VVIARGSICWADLGEVHGSKPAKRRPVLVIQSDPFNVSRLSTTVAAVITSNTALVTLDKTDLDSQAGHLPASLMEDVDRGLRRVLGL
jgi:mRNA interferase MazF